MTIDSSVVVAIRDKETSAPALEDAIVKDPIRLISTMSVLEVTCVLTSRHGPKAADEISKLLARLLIRVVPFDQEHLAVAQQAWLKFGKGFHAAGLNFGDCAAYALSRTTGEPLLYVGDDFGKTDVAAVAY